MSEDAILALLTRIEAGLTRVESEQTAFRADIMSRIDRLQNTVEAMHDDTSLNMVSANTAPDRTGSSRAEVENTTEMLLAMYRQIMRIRTSIESLQQ